MKKIIIRITLLVVLVLPINKLLSQCPDVEVIDLRNVPGYAQFDNLSVCGAADTLSLIIYSGDPGRILGFELEVKLPDGLEYADWAFTQFNSTSIVTLDNDLSCPKFIVDGFDGDSLIVLNIGVSANCDVDKNSPIHIDFPYSYKYLDTLNVLHSCSGTYTPSTEYNSAIRIPILNVLSSVAPEELEISAIDVPFCQTIEISQDGLSSYLDSFYFEIKGLDFTTELGLVSITANNSVPVNYTFNPSTNVTEALIFGNMFTGNTIPNPANQEFNTNELLTLEVCYDLANCSDATTFPFIYSAKYGCSDEICLESAQASAIKIAPTGSLMPVATSALMNAVTICGSDGHISLVVDNANTIISDQNQYTDLVLGYKTCASSNLSMADVTINGNSLSADAYDWIDNDLFINLKDLPVGFDPDGPGGLEDLDGDGVFDDLAAGSTFQLDLFIGIRCMDTMSGDCTDFLCSFSQFFVEGKTNCGNDFTSFPPVSGFDLSFGQTNVANPNEVSLNANNTVFGYDFAQYSNDGPPVAAGPKTVTVEFCYTFDSNNVNECPSTPDTKLEVLFSGEPKFIQDLEFVAGSAEFSDADSSNYVPVADALVDTTRIGESTLLLTINAGSTNSNICYKYDIELDSCLCTPAQFFGATQRVVSVCNDCEGGCEVVKGCRSTIFRADPECSPCPCPAEYVHERSERKNLGYTDKTMTTKRTRDDLLALSPEDLSRFMPGDTMEHIGHLEIHSEDILYDMQLWSLNWYFYPLGGNFHTAENMSLIWDGENAVMDSIHIENPDGSIQAVDFASLSNCQLGGTSGSYNSINSNFRTHPYLAQSGDLRTCGAWHNSHDGFDNNYLNFTIENYEAMQECHLNNPNLAVRAPWGEGDCLTEFIETYNITVGSILRFKFEVPLIKNPRRVMVEDLGLNYIEEAGRVYPTMIFYKMDDISGSANHCSTSIGSACRSWEPVHMDCAGDINSKTDMVLDNCGGEVTHTFTVKNFAGPPGDRWFQNEYRPLVEIQDVTAPIYSPLAYCGNAKVTQNGMATDIVVGYTDNMECSPVAGYTDNVCGVSNGALGHITFQLDSLGFQGLGIGLDSDSNCDTIRITYDLCMVCPAQITDLQNYELLTDWTFAGHKGNECTTKAFLCTNSDANTNVSSFCDEYGFANVTNYWDALGLDTLLGKKDVVGEIGQIDNSAVMPVIPLSTDNLGANLIASNAPGVSEEIQPIRICNPDPSEAIGVSAYVSVPASVRLENVYADANGTTPLSATLVSDDGQVKKYNISLTSTNLASNACVNLYIGTTLLYCPAVGELSPNICVGGSSGCAPEAIKAALGGTGICNSSEVCYAYLFGESGLQSEWFDPPTNNQLCDELIFNMRVKNVKELVLLDLVTQFDLPQGLSIDLSSWEVAYPGGPSSPLNWLPVPPPDSINGSTYIYTDDDIWSAAIGSIIHTDGLEGVSAANATADSNKVAFRFKAITLCDQFLSGAKLLTQTSAADPCSDERLSSGFEESASVIISNANPANFAQLIIIADPEELNCNATNNTFGITAINTSDHPTTDSVITCITIPDGLTYAPNSLNVVQPAGYVIPSEQIDTIGNAIQLCFASPKIGVSQAMKITLDAAVDPNYSCGDVRLDVDVKSVVEDQICSTGPACDVFVQNSINSSVNIEIKPPFIADNWQVYSECATGDDVNLYYEFTINHNGPDATNQPYTTNFYQDYDGDGSLNPNIDILLGSDNGNFTVADGNSTDISGNVVVPNAQSCPILMEIVYPSECVCDREVAYIDNIGLHALVDYAAPISMCPGDCINIEVCDFVEVTGDSIRGASGIPYTLEVIGKHFTLPSNGASLSYEVLTNDSHEPADSNFLSRRENTQGDAFIVAHYPYPVSVSSFWIGGGQLTGWTFDLQVYSGVAYELYYSHDGFTWFDSGHTFTGPDGNFTQEEVLASPITAQHWRLSSKGVGAWWTTSEFRLEGGPIPFQGASPVTRSGNTVSICLPDGVGIEETWKVDFVTGTGTCEVSETIEIWNIGNNDIDLGEDLIICGAECFDVEVELIGNGTLDNASIVWTPTTGMTDPLSLETEICNLTTDVNYIATVSFPGGCIKKDTIAIDYRSVPVPSAPSERNFCIGYETPTLIAPTGYAQYKWFQVFGTSEVLVDITTTPDYEVADGGVYRFKAFNADDPCFIESEDFMVFVHNCIDSSDYPDTCPETPCHDLNADIYLGDTLTADSTLLANNTATGDIDEGVDIFSSLDIVPGGAFRLPVTMYNVTGTTAYLYVWVDWNGDGDFSDTDELITITPNSYNNSGSFTDILNINVPSTLDTDQIGIRFRFSTDNSGNTSDACGTGTCAQDGEVEDYIISVDCKSKCLPATFSVQKEDDN